MKKLLLVLSCLLMLASCIKVPDGGKGGSSSGSIDSAAYIEKIKNYTVREKNPDNTTDNEDFDKLLDEIFVDALESDYLNMHFNVTDYRSFNLNKPPVDIGELSYGIDEEEFKKLEDQLAKIQSFDFDSLSYRQQYDYEAMEYSLYETLADYAYYQFDFLFSTGSNLPENLISNFTDFTFYDEESVQDYLILLADIDRYFDDALTYTKDQADDGYPPIDAWIDYTQETCEGVLNKTDDNAFIVTFDDRIDQLDFLDDDKKKEYKEQNRKIVLDEVLPAYEKINEEIEQYRGTTVLEDYALCNLDKNYAELAYILAGSNNVDMDTVLQQLTDNLTELEDALMNCYYDSDSYDLMSKAESGEIDNLNLVSEDCLEFLRTHLTEYYPDLGSVSYDVQELDPDTAPATAIAYYWPSPIDDDNQNIIRTNPNNMTEGISTYSTLAHEGFPGHLYQHVYYSRTSPHNFRSVIGFIGYTEGWAVNAQKFAIRFSGIDNDDVATALFLDDSYYFTLYSMIDLCINYFGWSNQEIADYFEENSMLFSFDADSIDMYREFLIEMPAVYCSYGIGSSNFAQLERETKAALGNRFDYVKYHETLMKNGPLPFNILKSAVDEYIEDNR